MNVCWSLAKRTYARSDTTAFFKTVEAPSCIPFWLSLGPK